MNKDVVIQMMGEFVITVDGKETTSLVGKSRKGVALMQYLILNNGKPVPKRRLLNVLWPGYAHANPENALKTLVSRMRRLLDTECGGLGECIISTRGAYLWDGGENTRVDLLEIMQLFEKIPREDDIRKRCQLYEKLIRLYQGDLFLTGDIEGGESYEAALHTGYLESVYDYVELLRTLGDHNRIAAACEKAILIDRFDDRLHMEMMQALMDADRYEEALEQYNKVKDYNERYLDTQPSEEMQDFYHQMLRSSDSLKFNLDFVRKDLREGDNRTGAYVCDYATFRDFCHLERFNLERLGCTLFLGLIMLYREDIKELDAAGEAAMTALMELTQENLRKGDMIVRYAPTIVAVLLPTATYTTGNMIMERIRHLFKQRFPKADIPFHYRLGELGTGTINTF